MDSISEFRKAVLIARLRQCPLFSDLAAPQLTQIAAITTFKNLEKGRCLFHEGAGVRGFFIVQGGAIKTQRVTASGRERLIHMFTPYESLAEEALVSTSGHLTDAWAVEDSQILEIEKNGFIALIRQEPALAVPLFKSMDRHIHNVVGLLDDLTLKDVKTRLAQWLLQHCPDPESREPVRIRLTTAKRLLASQLGAASETLSRAVAVFRDQKLVAVDGQTITLLCPQRLNRLMHARRVRMPRVDAEAMVATAS